MVAQFHRATRPHRHPVALRAVESHDKKLSWRRGRPACRQAGIRPRLSARQSLASAWPPPRGSACWRSIAPAFSSLARAKPLARSSPRHMQNARADGPDALHGGEGEIRTHGPREGATVFKTVALNRSATSPTSLLLRGWAGPALMSFKEFYAVA